MSDSGLLQAQCNAMGVAAPTVCEQGSVGTSCSHNANLCAANGGSGPCNNGGGCSLRARDLSGVAADACGCAAGEGWSKGDRGCSPGKSTSRSEAVDCALRAGQPVTTECDCVGGWSGATCELPRRDAFDGCGCERGAGWSKSGAACVAGGTTTASEAADCSAAGQAGVPSGCLSADALAGEWTILSHCVRFNCFSHWFRSLLAAINSNCPAKGQGRLTPDSCPAACAPVYLLWRIDLSFRFRD